MQSLEAHFSQYVHTLRHDQPPGSDNSSYAPTPEGTEVERYLPWLARDGQLAREVAEAWNLVVDREEADVVKCPCERCSSVPINA